MFGSEGNAIELADPDPVSIATRLQGLLEDAARRERLAEAGTAFVEGMTWSATADTIEHHLRAWLGERWLSVERDRAGEGEVEALVNDPRAHLA